MSLRYGIGLLILALVLCRGFVPAAQADGPQKSDQAENQPYKFSTHTNLVVVPVVVLDGHGNHVSGLRRDQFVLSEEGKEQEIARFEEVNAETTPAQMATVPANVFTNQIVAPRPKKLEIIVLDLLNTPLSGRVEAQRGLMRFLEKSANPDALLALFVVRSDGPHLIHNFTSDSQVLVAAIRKLQNTPVSRDTPALNTNGGDVDAEALEMRAIMAGAAATAQMGRHPTAAAARAEFRGMEALSDVSQQNQQAVITLDCLQAIAQYFAGVPGRKSLLWASTGFTFGVSSITGTASRGTTLDEWQRTIRKLQETNIAVYPVDVGGLSISRADIQVHGAIPSGAETATLEGMGAGGLVDPVSGKHQTMDILAQTTGGEAFYNLNDSDKLFRRASEDFAQYYMLAYYTKDTGKYGWRKLRVKVKQEGVGVRSRSGFFFDDPKRGGDIEAAYKDLEIAMTSDLNFTSIPLRGQWSGVEPSGTERKAHFVLSIPPGVPAIDAEHENHVSLDFLVVATDTAGNNVKLSKRLDTKLNANGVAQIQNQGLDYSGVLSLPLGNYRVHFVVRDNLRGTMGSVVTSLKLD